MAAQFAQPQPQQPFIVRAYDVLWAGLCVGADLAVRSSATAEDLLETRRELNGS